jgi:hypothetical protein
MAHSKVLTHPDLSDITRWLKVEGNSVREVEKRLAQKYPGNDQGHLRVSFSALQSFKRDHLQLEGQVLKDVKENSKMSRLWAKRAQEVEDFKNTSAYRETIAKIADTELNSRQKIMQIFAIIESRLEALFDKASSIDFIDKDVESLMQNYLKQLRDSIESYKKFEEGYAEKVDVNLNFNIATEQIQMIREAVRETLSDLDPDVSLKFMGNLNEKMRRLTYGTGPEANKHAILLDNALGKTIEADVE